MIKSKGTRRPTYPFGINSDSPEAVGLLSWLPVIGGASLRDFTVPFNELPIINGANFVTSEFGMGLDSFSANDLGARITAPSYLKGLSIVTLTWTGIKLGTPTANSEIFGVSDNNTDSAPYIAYGIGTSGSASLLRGEFTSSANLFSELAATFELPNFTLNQIILSIATGDQKLYHNGVLVASNALGFPGISAGATAQYCVGINGKNLSRNPNIITYDARVYNRLFSSSDVAEMWNNSNPWGLYARIPTAYKRVVEPAAGAIISNAGSMTGAFVNSQTFTG